MALVGRDLDEHLVRDLLELADSGADDAGCAGLLRRRIGAAKLLGEGDLGGIGVHEGEPLQGVAVEDVDDAPVGEVGNGQLGDALQRPLVGERGRELVARAREESEAALRVLCVEVESRVRDGERRPGGELLGALRDVRVVRAVRLGPREGERPDRPPVGDERHCERGARREPDEQLEVPVVARRSAQRLEVESRKERRLARAERRRRGLRRAEVRRVVAAQLVEELLLVRLRRGRGDAVDAAVRLQDVDDAPVGELRDGEAQEARKRLLVLERAGEHGGGLRGEAQAPLRLLGRGGELGTLERAADPPSDQLCERPLRLAEAPAGARRHERERAEHLLADAERDVQERDASESGSSASPSTGSSAAASSPARLQLA